MGCEMKKTLITIVAKNSCSIKERRKMVRSILKTMDNKDRKSLKESLIYDYEVQANLWGTGEIAAFAISAFALLVSCAGLLSQGITGEGVIFLLYCFFFIIVAILIFFHCANIYIARRQAARKYIITLIEEMDGIGNCSKKVKRLITQKGKSLN